MERDLNVESVAEWDLNVGNKSDTSTVMVITVYKWRPFISYLFCTSTVSYIGLVVAPPALALGWGLNRQDEIGKIVSDLILGSFL